MPVDIQKGSLVIEHQGLPGDLVGAGLLQGRIGGKLALAPLPVVDPARLDSTRHHVLRVPSAEHWKKQDRKAAQVEIENDPTQL